jgi:predicted HicB family RNase H-like nuclease
MGDVMPRPPIGDQVRSESLKIRLTPKLKTELSRLAKEAKRSLSDYVVLALEEHAEHAKPRKK